MILLCDDDQFLADSLGRLLMAQGYEVQTVHSGQDCIAACAANKPELLVLDLGLPDIDGLTVCKQVRVKHRFPILMLTSRSESIDKVMGLDVGADDYLTKPFDAHELLARVKALLRRSKEYAEGGESAKIIQLPRLLLDRSSRTLSTDTQRVELTETEFRIVEYLAINRGRAISREQLFEHIWGFDIEYSSNSLEVLVYRIRMKVSKAGGGELIHTMRGYGYRID